MTAMREKPSFVCLFVCLFVYFTFLLFICFYYCFTAAAPTKTLSSQRPKSRAEVQTVPFSICQGGSDEEAIWPLMVFAAP